MSNDGAETGNSLQRQLGRLIWRTGLKAGLTPDERRASWADERKDRMAQAGKMIRLMDEEGVTIALAPATAGETE